MSVPRPCRYLACILTLLPVLAASQQSPPATDIFLVEIDGRGAPGSPENVTRRKAYDNQPAFLPDGSGFLFTSFRDDAQTDILLYDLTARATREITDTPESEYSPTPIGDGTWISVVRVEQDGTQRLWKFPLEGDQAPELVLSEIAPVGYHVWIDAHRLGLFVLGDPPTLRIASTETGGARVAATNIGRSLHRVPGKAAISFVHKESQRSWWIRELDTESEDITPLVQTLDGSEDYAFTPEGDVLMASGSTLYRWSRRDAGAEWQELADWSVAGVRNVTRLAIAPSGTELAFVADFQSP